MKNDTKLALQEEILNGLTTYLSTATNNGVSESQALSLYFATIVTTFCQVIGDEGTRNLIKAISNGLDEYKSTPDWAKNLQRGVPN